MGLEIKVILANRKIGMTFRKNTGTVDRYYYKGWGKMVRQQYFKEAMRQYRVIKLTPVKNVMLMLERETPFQDVYLRIAMGDRYSQLSNWQLRQNLPPKTGILWAQTQVHSTEVGATEPGVLGIWRGHKEEIRLP